MQEIIIQQKKHMRFLLIFVFSASLHSDVAAQQLPWIKLDTSGRMKKRTHGFLSQQPKIGDYKLGTIYKLRQDNMPCFVPDTTGIRWMPNAISQNYLLHFKQIQNGYAKKSNTR